MWYVKNPSGADDIHFMTWVYRGLFESERDRQWREAVENYRAALEELNRYLEAKAEALDAHNQRLAKFSGEANQMKKQLEDFREWLAANSEQEPQ